MSRYMRGNVDETLSLGTLASRTLVAVAFDEVVVDSTRITSLVATWLLKNFTDEGTVGPILVGVAHSDYTAAEIEAFIENAGSWNEGSLGDQEIAKRFIRVIGSFAKQATGVLTQALNDGQPIKTKLNWLLTEGDTLDLWAYNLGATAIGTTVPDVFVQGHANLFPQ